MTSEEIARLFHDTYESLAPTFGCEDPGSGTPWSELGDSRRRLLSATVAVLSKVLRESDSLPAESNEAQRLEWERNAWQRRCGVLLAFAEEKVRQLRDADEATRAWASSFLDGLYRAVNQNPFTKAVDEPHADIARLTAQFTIDSAISAGTVVPAKVLHDLDALIAAYVKLEDEGESVLDIDSCLMDLREIAQHRERHLRGELSSPNEDSDDE